MRQKPRLSIWVLGRAHRSRIANVVVVGRPPQTIQAGKKWSRDDLLAHSFYRRQFPCGGGGSNPLPRVEQGTPPGTYSLVVSGTSSGISEHSITLTLVVQRSDEHPKTIPINISGCKWGGECRPLYTKTPRSWLSIVNRNHSAQSLDVGRPMLLVSQRFPRSGLALIAHYRRDPACAAAAKR